MNRFAALLDRLAYEPGRNAKLRLLTDYFRSAPDPDRGLGLAAMPGALSFRHAKPNIIRALIVERTDPVLFEMSYDYVGDLSETVALMWHGADDARSEQAAPPTPGPSPPLASLAGGGEQRGGSLASTDPPTLTTVVTTLAALGKSELPRQIARWLDELDETGRWALLKLVTGGLRIGVSARLAKTAVAELGGKDADEIELVWPALAPPYLELFAWLEGRAGKPSSRDPAPFRPPMLAHPIEDRDLAALDPKEFLAEWKWDGIRVQAVAGTAEDGKMVA